ncbi:MAG TPA: PAS domain S-box protein, partial [Sphingomicrobium sp.]|nr:PAS domain S-box protein [Sphingomicrobium sp.]
MNLTSSGGEGTNLTDLALLGLANDHVPILQQLSEGVIIAGANGKLLFVNQAAERLHGVKTLDVAPDDYSETYHLFTMDGDAYPFADLPLVQAVRDGKTVEDARWRIRRPDGSEVVAIGSARPLLHEGQQIGAILNVRDDSERFEAERRLRVSEERLRKIFEHSNDAIFLLDPQRDEIREANPKACTMFGYTREEIRVTPISQFHPKDLPAFQAFIEDVVEEGHGWTDEFACRTKDDRFVASEISASTITIDDRPCLLAIVRDITARKAADAALRESDDRLQLALNAATAIGTWDWDIRTDLVYADERFAELYSVHPERAMAGAPIAEFVAGIHPDDRERVGKAIEEAVATHGEYECEYRLLRADGEARWVIARGRAYFDEAGNPTHFPGVTVDITERRQVEQALRDREEQLRLVLETSGGAFYCVDCEGSTTLVSRSFLEMMGFAEESEVIGEKLHGLIHHTHPDGSHYPVEECPIYRCASSGASAHVPDELFFRRDGTAVPVEYWVAPIMRGNVRVGATCTILDLTDRKAAEQALRERSEEFYALADNIPALAWMAYADGNIFWFNRRWYEFTGTVPEDQAGWGWEAVHHPDTLPAVLERWTECLEHGTPFEMTFPLRNVDGEYRPFLTRAVPIRDDQGQIVRWFGTNVDVSEQVEAEQALTRLNETLETRVAEEVVLRVEAEEALRQSQKMETLGQLTGGIAHDFNNLLQIITGNLDILRRTIPKDSPRLERSVENALKGAERAAVLTQRLLAFSRRQPLVPKVFNPNKLVSGMSELLFRAIGETVAVETVLGSGLWRVEADSNQLENALLNLAVNSRDAMPDGGKLTIETANTHLDRSYAQHNSGVAPGQYVVICISDTGSGMDAETAERAFDPFFTTKEVGKGTGLGLSMVYGFVKQSGGHLKIYSEHGEGTTIKIYLPRHHGEEVEVEDKVAPDFAPQGDDSETILVCEDDDDVRAYSAQSLRELGYHVIEAADGQSALRLLESAEGNVDLLFTDIVLPGGMTGAIVAERARTIQPG